MRRCCCFISYICTNPPTNQLQPTKQVKHAYSFLCHYEKREGVVPNLQAHTDREDNQVRR